MKFLARFATGHIALWCAFWLIGIPAVLLWDYSGACILVGCGIEGPILGEAIIALFALLCVVVPLVSVAVWRSASNYPRGAWWRSLLAYGAKLCAVLSGLAAVLSLLFLAYMAFIFISEAINRADVSQRLDPPRFATARSGFPLEPLRHGA